MSLQNENDVDQLLRQYFRRETPSRWPDAPGGSTTLPAQQSWTLSAGRMLVGGALVATIALYLSLSSFFASNHKVGLDPNGAQQIGHKPKPPAVNKLPAPPNNP